MTVPSEAEVEADELPDWMSKAARDLQDEIAAWFDRHPLLRHATALDKRNAAYIAGWTVLEIGPESCRAIAAARVRENDHNQGS